MATQSLIEVLSNIKEGDTVPLNIATEHPLYSENKDIWEKCRDAVDGDEAIKQNGKKYLFQLNGQTPQQYSNYLNRAQWFGATSRTVDSYMGMIFRKSPQIFYKKDLEKNKKVPDEFFKSISVDGQSLNEFMNNVTEEIISVNRCGVLVEFPQDPAIVDSAVSEYAYEEMLKAKDIRPILSKYTAETIVNWNWAYIGRDVVPMYFVLKEETYNSYEIGTMLPVKTDIYRVLLLEPYEGGFRYKQIKFQNVLGGSTSNTFSATEVVYPKMAGEYISRIPFYVLDDKGINYRTIRKPMINALVNQNIGHFRNSADHENETHMVGTKTIVFPGWEKKVHGDPHIGGALAVPLGCEPKILEASSDSGITEAMKTKVEQMAVLGAERISNGQGYVASTETARVSNASESSSLTLLSTSLGNSFSVICDFLLSWARYKDTGINIQVNKDFFQDDIKGSELLEWMKAWQNGGISDEVYFYNLKKKEVYPENWDWEVELDAIQKSLDRQFNLTDEKYIEILEKFESLKQDVALTITTSSSGQTLLSASTTGGGSNISTSTEVSEGSMESATARNNETPGSSSASADSSSVDNKDDAEKSKKKAEDQEKHDPEQ
jgi:hypothetical protein